MSARSKLKQALSAIDDAQKSIKRAQHNVTDDSDIRRALRELDDAESDIKKAIRDLPDE